MQLESLEETYKDVLLPEDGIEAVQANDRKKVTTREPIRGALVTPYFRLGIPYRGLKSRRGDNIVGSPTSNAEWDSELRNVQRSTLPQHHMPGSMTAKRQHQNGSNSKTAEKCLRNNKLAQLLLQKRISKDWSASYC